MAYSPVPTDAVDERRRSFESKFQNISRNKYKVSNHTYPLGLGVNEDLQHYVAFFINVRGKSKFNKNKGGFQETFNNVRVGEGQNRLDPNNTGKAIEAAGAVTGAQAGGLSGILSGLGDKKATTKAVVSTVAGAGAGYASARILQKTGILEPDTLKRLSEVITLHVQETPTVKYNVNYQSESVGTLGGLLAGGSSAVDTFSSGLPKDASAAVITGIVKAVQNVGVAQGGRLLELGTKQKTNSFKEQFFESVDFRTFSFRHTFMPTSPAEMQNVKNIIDLFKFHMHPELSASGLFYIYPSEFEIKYYYRDRENEFLNKISSCVLTSMNVDYGGDAYSTFDDGKPVEVRMSLTFQEVEILTKERVKEGY